MRANLIWEVLKKNVPRSHVISGTASTTVARKLLIPVIFEPTRLFTQNLLNKRTVLVQRNWRWKGRGEDR
jgi:hypothetical protein